MTTDSQSTALDELATFLAERGMTVEDAVAALGGNQTSPANAASSLELIKRPQKRRRAEPIPEEMIPTRERLDAAFYSACAALEVTPDESWRPGVIWLRITQMLTPLEKLSQAPIRQMELSACECARLHILPDAVFVEIAQTNYVRFDEDKSKRPVFNRFMDELREGRYKDYVLVAQRMDRLVRTVSIGSILLERCQDGNVDILEFGRSAKLDTIPRLEDTRYDLHQRIVKAQQEWEDASARQRETRDWKVNRGDLVVGGGLGHLQRFVPGENGRLVLAELLPDTDYQPYVRELLERIADYEAVRSISRDFSVRATEGRGLRPAMRIENDGSESEALWYPRLITKIARSATTIGCQRNSKGELVRCPAIHPLVDEELWLRANAALDATEAATKKQGRRKGGGVKTRIGVGLLTCAVCGDTAHARHNGYQCAKRGSLFTRRDERGDQQHFHIPLSIDQMIRAVTVGLLDSLPETAERAKALASRRESVEADRALLQAEQRALQGEKARIVRNHHKGVITAAQQDADLRPIDARLDELSVQIAATFQLTRTILDSLREGETWATRWDSEYARGRDGLAWLAELLEEVWERIEVASGPGFRGCNANHEARLTFYGRDGLYEVDPEFVRETAFQLYAQRALEQKVGHGWNPISKEAESALVRLHRDGLSAAHISDRMNGLLDTDPVYAPISAATEGQKRRDSGRWSGMRVSHALKRIYEERGMAWVPNGRDMISHADQELLKALHEDHGSRATARMMNKLGKVTATGNPWITDDVDRMIARLERIERLSNVGRKRLLLDDEIAVVTTMRDRGSSLAEIQAFLAAQPTPIHVSVPTLSRRITEHRKRLAAAALSARDHA